MREEGGSEGEDQRTQCKKQAVSPAGRRRGLGRADPQGTPGLHMVEVPDRHRGPPWMSSELPKEDHRGNT